MQSKLITAAANKVIIEKQLAELLTIKSKMQDSTNQEIAALEAELDKTAAITNELQSKLTAVETEKIAKIKTINTQMQEKIGDMKNIINDMQANFTAEEKKMTAVETELAKMITETDKIEDKITKAKNAIIARAAELDTVTNTKNELQTKLTAVGAEVATIKTELIKVTTSKTKNLADLIPSEARNLGKLYIGEIATSNNKEVVKIITDILKNKYNLDLAKIEIDINDSEKQALIKTIDEGVYLRSVTITYELDTSFVTLDYLVPDIKTRKQQVFPYLTNAHEDIVTVKHQILGENEFQDLSLAANFINELSQKVKYQASSQSLAAFKKLETNNANFKDFTDLKTQFNDYNGQFKGQINLDAFIETITNNFHHYNKYNYYQINVAARINELKAQMVRFYNILAQVYGKKMF